MKKNYFTIAIVFAFQFISQAQSITFSELNYNSDSTANSGNWVEILNYGASAIDISNWILKDGNDLHSFKIPASTVLQAGARIVVVNDAQKFSTEHPFIPYIGEMTFSFSNTSDEVRLYNSNGDIKVYMAYADSTPWPKAVDGTGRTLEIKDPLIDPNDPSNWFAGCMFGSPGYAYSPCNEPLVFDEINYHSDTLIDAGDWVEIQNRTGGYINLTGYSFKDSKDANIYYFPLNYQLEPQGRVVLVHDTAIFFQRHPNVTNWLGPLTFNLSNGGELIRLFDYNGKMKYSMIYHDQGSGWPSGADGGGYTLELLDATKDVNVAENWFAGCLEGSPGYAYNPNCNVGIQSELNPTNFVVTNLYDNQIAIQSANDAINTKIEIIDLMGKLVFHSSFIGSEFLIDLNDMTSGIYILRIHDQNLFLNQKILVK